jgi:phosphoglycerate dehydrogenase-like enzyme
MKIVVPDFVLDYIQPQACTWLDQCEFVSVDREGGLDGNPAGAEVVMLPWGLSHSQVERLLRLPSVRWVHTVTAGIDHALAALSPSSEVRLTNARGIFDVPIAEMVMAYVLSVTKRLPEFRVQQAAHTWALLRLRELRGLTMGIVGLGSIGVDIAKRAQVFGMRVIATRRHPEKANDFVDEIFGPQALNSLLEAAHFVVIAAPLTEETRGMIGTAQLRRMREDAWLINIARGEIVDQSALSDALKAGWIAGAALDVFEEEPLPPDSPLWDMPNVVVTPHNSWSTPYLQQREAELFLDNLDRYLRGASLRNVIDPAKGY